MSVHQDQIDYWNGPTGLKWAKYQTEMDRNLQEAAIAGLQLAKPRPGEQVLDIGCGSGETSLLLAEAVGPGGKVTGVDISQPMLTLARVRAEGRNNLQFVEADAAFHAFRPEFDLIFSRFGVMFFADPVAAFANIRKAAVPDGRLAFVCWRSAKENEWASYPFAAAKPHLPEQKPGDPNTPGPFAFADPERVRRVLSQAGFRDVAIEAFDGEMDLGGDPEHAGFQLTSLMGPTSRALKNVDDATRAKVRDAVREAMTRFLKERGHLRPGIACWLVTAKA